MWGRRRKITFNNSGQTEDLDNVPVLIRLDSNRIDYGRTQANGWDIRFVDADGRKRKQPLRRQDQRHF